MLPPSLIGVLVVKVYHQVEQLNPGGGGRNNSNAAPTPTRRLPFASVGWETPLTRTYSISSIKVEGILVAFVTCNYRYEYQSYSLVFAYRVASKCYLLITPITLLLLNPTVRAISAGSAPINGGREENPPLENVTGGASAARSSGPRQSPSPATPELAPGPWDPVRVLATDAAAPLFLPPALSLIHPALYLPASIFVLLTGAQNTAPCCSLPLHGHLWSSSSLSGDWRGGSARGSSCRARRQQRKRQRRR